MKRQGFTLIELLVVISIISLLSSVVLASLNSAREKGRTGGANYFATQVDHIAGDYALGIWDFDECSNTIANDRSGNGNHLNLQGNATFSTDTPIGRGCSLTLDGVGDYASALSMNAPLSTSLTISYWLYIDIQAGNFNRMVSGSGGANIYFNGTGSNGLYGTVGNSGSGWISCCPNLTGKWNHITITVDASDGKIKGYVNGTLKSTTNSPFSSATFTNLYVGSEIGGASYFLNGKMDNLRVYSKSLTATDVGRLYAAEASKVGLSFAF